MSHQTVNHSLNFVDPATGVHTQGIESTWSQVKRMMRREGVMATSPDLFQSYLSEFLWRRKIPDLSGGVATTIQGEIKQKNEVVPKL